MFKIMFINHIIRNKTASCMYVAYSLIKGTENQSHLISFKYNTVECRKNATKSSDVFLHLN